MRSVSPARGCHTIRRFSIQAHRPVENEGESGQQQDACEHGVDVEYALGLVDQVAHTHCRSQVLTHHRADERKAHRIVQAREHPAHRARKIDMAQQLSPTCAEHARIGEH